MNLSSAEQNVFTYIVKGYSNQEIADKLCVCEKTVKFHLTNIYKKADVKSRNELMAKYYRTEEEEIRGVVMKDEKEGLSRGVSAVVVSDKPRTQEDKIKFIDQQFKVGDAITQLHQMMTKVTEKEINPATVNAACNCVARLNETINTAIQAAKFLNER